MNFKQFIRPGRGKSDLTPLFSDGPAFSALVDAMAALFEGTPFDKIVCVEGRGFLIGAALAYKLNAGLVLVRREGKLANDTYSYTYTDYSGKEKTLEIHRDALHRGQPVLIVDDWVQTGNTIRAALDLVEKCGGEVSGIAAFMDDSTDELKRDLLPYSYKYLEQVADSDSF